MLHGRTHEAEQAESFARRQPTRPAVDIDWLPLDVLHDEIREAVIGRTGIEERGDVWMIEARQNLPFAAKALKDGVAVTAAFDELDRDLFAELLVRALGQIHRAHAAPTQLANNPVRTDPAAHQRTACRFNGRRGARLDRRKQYRWN